MLHCVFSEGGLLFIILPFITIDMAENFNLAHQQSTQCVSNCYGSLFQITINIKKLCSITEFIGTLEVNINHSSCMGQNLEIVINSYQSRPESVYLALVTIAINLICQLLLLCYQQDSQRDRRAPMSSPSQVTFASFLMKNDVQPFA